MSERIEVNTILKRGDGFVQVSDISMRKASSLCWSIEVEFGLVVDTVDWDALRGEIDSGKTEVVDKDAICGSQKHCDKCELVHMC